MQRFQELLIPKAWSFHYHYKYTIQIAYPWYFPWRPYPNQKQWVDKDIRHLLIVGVSFGNLLLPMI